MQKALIVHNQELKYEVLRSSRAKYVRVAVHPDGRVILTVPPLMPLFLAERFFKKKACWALRKVLLFKDRRKSGVKIPELHHTQPRRHYLENKDKALNLAQNLIEQYRPLYGFNFNRVSIKNPKTRWGSCSRQKNLNFNYRILFLPPEIAGYIIVHELCHLQELNHSRRFWTLVEKTFPNHKALRKRLRSLHS